MIKKYIVDLTEDERQYLFSLISKGKTSTRKLTRVRILLKADKQTSNWSDLKISEALNTSTSTIERVRKQFVTEGIEAAINQREPSRRRPRKLDGRQEAHLVTLACSKPPGGRETWTFQLLADTMVTLGHVDSISHETVRQVLKKTT